MLTQQQPRPKATWRQVDLVKTFVAMGQGRPGTLRDVAEASRFGRALEAANEAARRHDSALKRLGRVAASCLPSRSAVPAIITCVVLCIMGQI